jgi:signal transduction histidine kinase
LVAAVTAAVALLIAATYQEADRAIPQPGQTILVPLVGATLMLGGLVTRTSGPKGVVRWALGVTGAAWLLPSLAPGTEHWHQAALVLALGAALAPSRLGRVAPGAGAIVLTVGSGGQAAAGAVFAALAIAGGVGRRPMIAAAASAVGVVLAVSWAWQRTDPLGWNPDHGLIAYELSLILAALLLGPGTRIARPRELDTILDGEMLSGLDGLADVLRSYLHEPSFRIDPPGRPGLPVLEGERQLAVIRDGGPALEDPATREAVVTAVRLVALADERRRSLDRNTAELERAQARLSAAMDAERAVTAERLRDAVLTPVQRAMASLADLERTDEVGSALDQLAQSLTDVRATALGLAPRRLGDGRLAAAVTELADRSPVRCSVEITPGAAADTRVETTLFYVCSEAITNAAKHARAQQIVVSLRTAGDALELIVADDGDGGADPAGLGLRGLADRVSRIGGTLRLESPPGAGTAVIATLPLSRTRSVPAD